MIFCPNDPVNPTHVEQHTAQNKALYMLTKAVEDKMLACYVRIEDPAVLWAELCHACAGAMLVLGTLALAVLCSNQSFSV